MRNQHKLQTLRWTMRGIVEDVLWEGNVLTTDEIYRGVKAKHAQLRQLLPPRWQEKVRQILEAHCISHEGNLWFLENFEQSVRQLLEAHCISHEGNSRFFETSLFDSHDTPERIINDSNRGQKRTDWASTESYRYLDLALPESVAGDMVRNVVLGTFLFRLRQLRRPWPTWVIRAVTARSGGYDGGGWQGGRPENKQRLRVV